MCGLNVYFYSAVDDEIEEESVKNPEGELEGDLEDTLLARDDQGKVAISMH